MRDFEYVQPLYNLAFLLEVAALGNGAEVPKYRTFSLWRAAYHLDGYGTTIDRWLGGGSEESELDHVPSNRIRRYLENIRSSGTIEELAFYDSEQFNRCLRLRSVRGLGPSTIALTISSRSAPNNRAGSVALNLALSNDRVREVYDGEALGPWQAAHIVPPLLRFLRAIEKCHGVQIGWDISGLNDPFHPVSQAITVDADAEWNVIASNLKKALTREKHFRRVAKRNGESITIRHQMGWGFSIQRGEPKICRHTIEELAQLLDPLASSIRGQLLSDLHLHTAWSDGSAPVNAMAAAIRCSGLKYFAVTDHSRTSKVQGGLTPPLWLRQANALALAVPVCPVLHGIEVDILKDGSLDLPHSLLTAADIVVASVHSNWTDNVRENTERVLKAIETGCVDVLAHPTSALTGKPGIPDYMRPPARLDWEQVFSACAKWSVALEFNCFPSRLDLPIELLADAVTAGCPISIGSDAHARSHLSNLRFGEAVLRKIDAPLVLNRLSYKQLKRQLAGNRRKRASIARRSSAPVQIQLRFDPTVSSVSNRYRARIHPPRDIPTGSPVVGIDLTAGEKASGVAFLQDGSVETCSLLSDHELLAFIKERHPRVVSIDSPLGLPGGGDTINPKAGIVRVAEHDLASIGIPAYPALIDSMRKLTLRGISLKPAIESLPGAPTVIESYPGAAQDILCIPRKQRSLELLREGLIRLGLTGQGLRTHSHDEMDAITAALVGRYFESGLYEPMGVRAEAQLIVPRVCPFVFDTNPVVCLAGKTGAGKSVVARYLGVFYGFEWIRTRDVVRELLEEDIRLPMSQRMFKVEISPDSITERHLREFGAIMLDDYQQIPLRKRLTEIIFERDKPIVIDSVRSIEDVDLPLLGSRSVVTWFIDCHDSTIEQRLAGRAKFGEKKFKTPSPVDHTAASIREQATHVLPNNGSLEELRWHVDDLLFGMLDLLC